MATAAMDAFVAATKRPAPQSALELKSVLDELPRRELQALGKAHGVRATLKRESLVEQLVAVLPALLWPAARSDDAKEEEKGTAAEVVVEEQATTVEVVEEKAAVAIADDQADKTTTESTTVAAAAATTKTAVVETAKKTKTTAVSTTVRKTAAVGKKAVAATKRGASSPGKLKKATPVKATALTPSKTMDKLHAKQVAKQMTLQEHEQAKKQRAALLLSGSKYSVVKKTRSKTKELTEGDIEDDSSVTKTLSFGAATPAKKAPSVRAKTTTATATATPKEAPSAKKAKTGTTYKPYAGPLPVFQGDSLFSPKKVTPRPAPMAVAVMKAARAAAPRTPVTGTKTTVAKKATPTTKATPAKKATPTKKSPAKNATPTKAATPTKKSPAKKSPSKVAASAAGKENTPATANVNVKANTTTSAVITKKTVSAVVTKARVTVKAAATTAVSHDVKKQERRSKFTQEAKVKSTATRREARSVSTSSRANVATKVTKTTVATTST